MTRIDPARYLAMQISRARPLVIDNSDFGDR